VFSYIFSGQLSCSRRLARIGPFGVWSMVYNVILIELIGFQLIKCKIIVQFRVLSYDS
jgi:hypothetical protein